MSTISAPSVGTNFFTSNRGEGISVKQASLPKSGGRQYWISVKGAPEVMRDMFSLVPDHYDRTYKHFAMNGSRVIALGWKWMSENEMRADAEAKHQVDINNSGGMNRWYKAVSRDAVENQLHFAGFLVFHCPLKPDTATAIAELHQSMHRIVMITGDNPLTACHVARELGILRRPTLILDVRDNVLSWMSVDESVTIPYPDSALTATSIPAALSKLLKGHDLCTTGRAFDMVRAKAPYFRAKLLSRLFVYARTSPIQKETVITDLKESGYVTMMVGDGTNDVGALKQAHVGVALLNGTKEDLEKASKISRLKRRA
jgi:cation-transporting ATPase 13A1